MPQTDKKYTLDSIIEEKNLSLIKLNELSRHLGLPIVGLNSRDGKLNMVRLEIDDLTFRNLKKEKDRLVAELNELGKTKDAFDPAIDEKYAEIEMADKQITQAQNSIIATESSDFKMSVGKTEAEEMRKSQLSQAIKNLG